MPNSDPNVPAGQQWLLPHPSWVPIWRAPFLYRYYPGFDGPVQPKGKSDEELERLLHGPGIRGATIDAVAGEFELAFEPDLALLFNFPIRFHPSEFQAEEIQLEKARVSAMENVELVWRLMREDFSFAVHAGRCSVFGRANGVLNSFTIVPPDVFRNFEVTNWMMGEAQAVTGERLFSLHVAPPLFGAPYAAPPEYASEIAAFDQISTSGHPLNAARKVRIAPKQQPALKALKALRAAGVGLDLLTPKEKTKKVADYLKQQGRPESDIPSSRTVERAAAVEQAQRAEGRRRR